MTAERSDFIVFPLSLLFLVSLHKAFLLRNFSPSPFLFLIPILFPSFSSPYTSPHPLSLLSLNAWLGLRNTLFFKKRSFSHFIIKILSKLQRGFAYYIIVITNYWIMLSFHEMVAPFVFFHELFENIWQSNVF